MLRTVAPADNHGKAESFSPTDLVATALGSCIPSVIGIKAAAMEVDIRGATATIDKKMVNVPSRLIHKLAVHIQVPHKLSDRDVKIFGGDRLYLPGA